MDQKDVGRSCIDCGALSCRNAETAIAAAQVEAEYYCKMTRIFRVHGFEVYGISCKAGARLKTSVGIPKECEAVGVNMCNPILQAKLLNAEQTDLNSYNIIIVRGQFHEILF